MYLNREVLNIFAVAATEIGRYAINNICVEAKDGKTIAVATNGRSLIKYEVKKEKTEPDAERVLISPDTCKRALKIGMKGRPLTITPTAIEAYGDSVQVKQNAEPPLYPKYEQILEHNKNHTHYEFSFDAVLMRDALDALIKIHGPDVKGCKKTIVKMGFQADNKCAAVIILDRGDEKSTALIMPDKRD